MRMLHSRYNEFSSTLSSSSLLSRLDLITLDVIDYTEPGLSLPTPKDTSHYSIESLFDYSLWPPMHTSLIELCSASSYLISLFNFDLICISTSWITVNLCM